MQVDEVKNALDDMSQILATNTASLEDDIMYVGNVLDDISKSLKKLVMIEKERLELEKQKQQSDGK